MFRKKRGFNYFFILISFLLICLWGKTTFATNINLDRSSDTINNNELIAQRDLSQVEIKTFPLKNNVYMLEGEGGNIGVSVGNDGVMIIDSQFPELSTKIQKAIEKISPQPIRYLINTHYHFDHTKGNENFANNGALIIAHDNVPKQMKIPHNYPVLGMDIPASSEKALPKLTFNDRLNFNLNGNEINAFHVPPAHTDGDIVIHFVDQNIIHTGDLFFNGMYPFIDTAVGGSVQGMINAIDRILALCNDETIIIPGHGQVANKEELIAFQTMLKTVNQRVKEGINKNMNLEQLISAKTLADLDEKWGKGFLNSDQFLTIAYQGEMKN